MADEKETTHAGRDSKRPDSSTSTSGYKSKPIDSASVNYWWHVLEGKKLVKVADYRFDPNVRLDSENSHNGGTKLSFVKEYMFTEESLPRPIRILNQKEKSASSDDHEPGRSVSKKSCVLRVQLMKFRYTLWVDDNRVCVGLEVG